MKKRSDKIKIIYNKKLLWIIIILIILFIILIIFLAKNKKHIPPTKECQTDSDCVPASCCHANSCVNVENKADCSSMKCTLSCEPGTLDCQQGKCVCENDRCTVKIG